MNRPTKIALGIVTAIAIFAVGVQYSDNVISFVNNLKRRFKKLTPDQLSAHKDEMSKDLMFQDGVLKTGVVGIGTRLADANRSDSGYIEITVLNEDIKKNVEEYLKEKHESVPVVIRIGEMAKAL